MPTGYTPQSSLDRRKALMNQLRQTPMNDTGKKTDWGRGLAHMLRQYQAGQMGREQEEQIARNTEIQGTEMADLVSGISNPGASKAQDFGSMGVFQGGAPQPKADPSQSGGQGIDPYSSAVSGIGQDLGSRMSGGEAVDPAMLAGAQENAVSTPALGDRKYSSPMAQKLKMQQVLNNASSDRARGFSESDAARDHKNALELQGVKNKGSGFRSTPRPIATDKGYMQYVDGQWIPMVDEDGDPRLAAQYSAALQGEISETKAQGAATGKRNYGMQGISEIIANGRAILTGDQAPTASGVGAMADSVGGFFGYSPDGADKAAEMKAVGGALTAKMPRMEGPQSDADRKMYVEMAGQIGDASVPLSQREAALDVVEALWSQYEQSKVSVERTAELEAKY